MIVHVKKWLFALWTCVQMEVREILTTVAAPKKRLFALWTCVQMEVRETLTTVAAPKLLPKFSIPNLTVHNTHVLMDL